MDAYQAEMEANEAKTDVANLREIIEDMRA
jgi:hypothetical protein